MRNNRKLALFFGLMMTFVLMCTGAASAADEVAEIVGGSQYGTVQEAIDVASDGDTIALLTDTAENVSISGKQLTFDLKGYSLTSVEDTRGGVYYFFAVTDGANVTVKNGTLAGAVDADGNPVQLPYAVYVAGSTFTLDDATISGHSVATSGGGIYADASTITLQNGAVVTGNTANGTAYTRTNGTVGDGGGGIYACNGSAVTIDASTISKNTATKAGGGVFLNASTLTVKNDSDIIENHAAATNSYNGGGGIYSVNKSVISLADSHVDNNTAAKYGAAIAVYNGPNFGNAEETLTISNSTVSGNATTGTSAYGSVYIYTGARSTEKISITGATFDKNESSMYCALYIQGGGANYKDNLHVTIKDSSFTGNKVNSTGSGSIVNVSYSSHLNISNTVVDSNTGGQAPVYFSNCTGFVADKMTVSNNTAYNAGGFYMMQCTGSMTGTSVTGNASTNAVNNKTAGGIAQQNDTSVSYTGCRISGNTSAAGTGGLFVGLSMQRTYHVAATLTGTVVTGNTGAYMGGITYIGNTLFEGSSLTVVADSNGNGAVYGNTCTGSASGHDLSITPDGEVSVMPASTMKDGDTALTDYAFVSGTKVYPKETVLTTEICGENANTAYTVQPYVERFVAQNVSGADCAANDTKYTLLGAAIEAIEGEESADATHVLKLIAGESDDFGTEIMENVTVSKDLEIQLNERTVKASTGTAITVADGAKLTLSGKGTVDTYQAGGVALTVNGECTVTGEATIPAVRLGADKSVAVTADAKIDKVYLDATVLKNLNLSAEDMSVILFTPYSNADLSALASSIEVQGINALVTVGLDADGNVVASCKKVQGVFVDGVNGKNTTANDGLSPDKAKKTIAEALKVLEANPDLGGIYVVNTVTLSSAEKWDGDLGGAWLKRFPSLTGAMISIPSGYTLSLSDVVVDGNAEQVNATEAMISVNRGGTLNITEGAQLCNNSRVNSASNFEYGGAVISYGTVNMSGGKVSGNHADQGGGICMYGSGAKLTLTGGSIENNTTDTKMNSAYGSSGGGVLLVYGADMDMSGGTVSGNKARYGGGIAVGAYYDAPDSVFTMTGGTVSGNEAVHAGGGMYIQTNCKGYVSGGSIINNVAAPNGTGVFAGGGIYVNGNRSGLNYNYGELHLTDAIITDNTAGVDARGPSGGGIGGCGTSHTMIFNTHSAAIYGNTNMDLALRQSAQEMVGGINPEGDLAEFMLGGGAYNWTDENGVQYTSTTLDNFTEYRMLKANPTADAIAAAQPLGKVIITGNSTGGIGGGIGTNGTVIIGVEEDVVDLPVTKLWNDADNEEQLTEKDGKYYLYPAEGAEIVHPQSFRIWLLRDGEKVSVVEFKAESGTDADGKSYLAWPKTMTFNDLPAGDYTYTIEETLPTGALYAGVASGDAANGLIITNYYNPTCSLTFAGTKSIVGREMTEEDVFNFAIMEGDKLIAEATSDGTGKINFPELTFNLLDVGEHTYTVKENTADGNGITADTNTYDVELTVTNNGDGTLSVTASSNYTALNFTNTYKAEGEVTFAGTKSIDERSLTADDVFTFQITETQPDSKKTWTAQSDATGAIAYPTISYTLDDVGTHYYRVKETSTDGSGITVDSTEHSVMVVISDNGDGTLKIETSENATALDFENDYEATGKVTFAGVKALSGRELTAADVFTFEIRETLTNGAMVWTAQNDATGAIAYPTITYDLSDVGTHTYTVKETSTDGNGITVDATEHTVTVKVSDNGDGTLKIETSENATALNFTNTYKAAGEVTFAGVKTISGRDLTAADVFSFEITDGTDTWTAENDATGAIAYPTISYDLSDVGTHTYTVKETSTDGAGITVDVTEHTVTVKVSDNGDGTLKVEASENATALNFTNDYKATGEVTFAGVKTLSGRDLTEADVFSFEITDGTDTWTVENDETGAIAYPTFTYDLSDIGTHTYTVKETSESGNGITVDATEYTVTVKVSDNGDGTLKVEASENATALNFTNDYKAAGEVTFAGVKTLSGRDLTAADVFSFEITDGTDIWTAQNDATGAIAYPMISYDLSDIGTHTYTVKETSTDGNGITVDVTEHTVAVNVSDNGDGTLQVEPSTNYTALNFTNDYKATGEVTFAGVKVLSGREMTADDVFSFEITDGTDTWTAQNDATGAIAYPTFTYDLSDVGTHTYTVKETSENGKGITVDVTEHTVTVKVSDNGDGTLNIEPSTNYTALDFTNTYKAAGEVTFAGVKTLSGRDLTAADVFSFEITDGTDTWTVENDATGAIAYPTLTYDLSDVGTHTYTVKETSENGKGITVDATEHIVTVKVSDNGDGTLKVEPSTNYNALNFTNTYKAAGEVTFAGVKVLSGRDLTENDVFSFEITDGTETWTVENDATGAIAYPTISYDLSDVGTHTYTVKEISTDGAGITVDATEHTVTVKVSDNGDGTLKVEPSTNYTALNFTNDYKATGEVTFAGVKTLSGRDLTETDVFSFEITDGTDTWTAQNDATGKIAYPTISYDLSDIGTHTYTVKETSTDGNGITVDATEHTVTVKVSDNGDGTLKVEPSTNYTALNFTNTYKAAGEVTFAGVKTINGRDLTEADVFSFEITDGTDTWTAQNDATGKIAYPTISYDLSDIGTHTYTVKETSTDGNGITVDATEHTVTVKVSDNGDGTLKVETSENATALNFTNTYKAVGEVTFAGVKALSGRDLTENDVFSFSVTDGTDTWTVENDATGAIAYPTFTYDLSDIGTHTYTVKETSTDGNGITVDATEHTVTVKVSDNGDGTLKVEPSANYTALNFTNDYKATGEVTFAGAKVLSGREMTAADVFSFEINDGTETWTAQNDATGKIAYPTISYDLSDVGEHTYTVKETSTDGNGITVDAAEHTVTVKVSDNGDGTLKVEASENATALNFTNTYKAAGEVTFAGVKALSGRELTAADVFTFEIRETLTNGAMVWTAQNDATGAIAYPTISYDLSDVGTHTYTVKETSTDGAGITVDATEYTVSVTVTDNGDGTLKVETSENATALNFTNTYKAVGEVTFAGVKVLSGRDLTETDVFSFEITDGTDTWTAQNDATGAIAYPTISYDLSDVGTHTYTVKETSENGKGITVDVTEHTVTVKVSDNGDGTLKVEPSANYNALDFTNTYEATGEVTFAGAKSIDGRDLTAADVFSFEITDGTDIWTAQNDATGAIAYPTISYDLSDVGTHTYTVKETSTDGAGITVDATEYTVSVTVTDNGDGTLKVEPSTNYTALNFTNDYKATGEVTFAGVKVLSGRDLTAADVFSFEITDGTDTWTAENDATGKIAYPTISYDLSDVGTHTYTVKETSTDGAGITVDATEYTVSVTVTDNGDGTLNIEPSANYTALNFTNDYKATGEVTFAGVKTLSGRDLTENDVFSFEITDGTDTWTVENDATGAIAYPTLTYDLSDVGTHTYTVKETSENGKGITVDATEHIVTVKVSDNGDGTLNIEPSTNYTALNFTNTYKAVGEVTFSGTKTIDGRDLTAADVFSFEITDGTDTWTVENDATGAIAYPKFTYDLSDVGTHTYTVKETSENGKGITVDATEHIVTVKVSDNGDGTLKVEPSANYTALNFTNTYKAAGEVTFAGTKTINGRDLTAADVFSFEITDGTDTWTAQNDATGAIAYPTFTYDLSDVGTHTYTVKETSTDGAGITVDVTEHSVTVKVSDNGDGTLNIEPSTNYTALDFTNTYKAAGEVTFAGVKTISGRDLTADDVFSFEITDGTDTWTAQNDATGAIAYPTISYTLSDVGTHTYTVKETSTDGNGITVDVTEHTVTVKVSDNGDGTLKVETSENATALNFTNTYEAAGEVTFAGTKTIDGRDLTAADVFSFEITDGTDTWTVENDETGAIAYPKFTYDLSDVGTHTYTVKETSTDGKGITVDATEYTVSVTVTDNGDGTLNIEPSTNYTALNFINTYKAVGEVTFAGVKALSGRDLTENDVFSFSVTDGTDTWTVENDATGAIAYPTISYDLSDVGTHTYTVKETSTDGNGITVDVTEHTVAVKVSDNGDGTLKVETSENATALNFTNTYEVKDAVTFAGTKTLVGREYKSGDEFVFELVENGVVVQRSRITPVGGQDAAFAFNPITYTGKEAGTYTYIIREKTGSSGGMTYDAAEYTVTVTVEDAGDGTMRISTVYTVDGEAAEEIRFTNTYEAQGELTLTADKTVNGAEPTAEQVFSFTLSDENGEIETVENTLGKIEFAKLTYTLADVGEHTYTVRENATEMENYLIDETVYTVKVTVADAGNGTLTATPVITANGKSVETMTFENTLCAPLTISKTVEGCTTEETFPITIWIFDAEGKESTQTYTYTGDVSGTLTSGSKIMLGHGQSVVLNGLIPGMKYTVEEAAGARYTTTVNTLPTSRADGVMTEGGNTAAFVNKLVTTSFSVTKVWQGDVGGAIRLTLYANGVEMEPQPEYQRDGDVYTYTGLPMYDEDGSKIVYAAKERYMDGYMTIYDNVEPYEDVTNFIHDGGTIINKSSTDFKVKKVWTGLGEDAEIPEITLVLYCNGEVYDRATPDPDKNGWYHYYNLPIYVGGERAVYSVVEVPMDGYNTSYTNDGEEGDCAYDGGVITNHLIPKTGDSMPIVLWTAATLMSAAVLMLIRRKKA